MKRNKYYRTILKHETTFNGILIIRNIHQHLNYWGCVVGSDEHFKLCKDDSTKDSWKRANNRLCTYYRTLDEAKEAINKYRDGSIVLYTDEQYNKYISNYNRKHKWSFTRQRLLSTMRMHKKGNKVMKLLMEARLEDANFHSYCSALADGDYNKFMEILNKEFRTEKEVLADFFKNNSKENIINGAKRDYDSTFGYILGLLKDGYNLSKIEAYPIAEKICEKYSL